MFQQKMFEKILLTISMTLLLSSIGGCSKGTPSSSKEKANFCQMAIYATSKTLHPSSQQGHKKAARDLKQALQQLTNSKVLLLPTGRQRPTKEIMLLAAKEGSPWVLSIIHPTNNPNGFVSATLYDVTSGQPLGDTAIRRDDAKAIQDKITQWLKAILSEQGSCTPFQPFTFLDRLIKEKKCEKVLSFLSDYEFSSPKDAKKSEDIYRQCSRTQLIKEASNRGGSRNLLRMKLEGVPLHLHSEFQNEAEKPYLSRAVHGVSQQFSDLVIRCGEACLAGRIDLTVQFNLEWYKAHLATSKEPFAPYQSIAKALLRYRNSCAKLARRGAIGKFALYLHLLDVTGEELIIELAGSEHSPKMTTNVDPQPFLAPGM